MQGKITKRKKVAAFADLGDLKLQDARPYISITYKVHSTACMHMRAVGL